MLEQYEVGAVVGRGGMGIVYSATHRSTGQVVALKRMNPAFAEDSRFVQRFMREANICARLDHPNIVKVMGVGTDPEGVPFMIMELLQGQTLDVRLKQGLPSEEETISIIRQSLLALQRAHKDTVMHRDIKPANIFLCNDGTVRVMDFGIAKALEDSKLTRTGAIIGTIYYMSPEQTQGKPIDTRSDLYSLGITLYEMLAGRFPFSGKSPGAVLLEKVQKPLAPLPETVSPWLQTVTAKALAKTPEERFQTAEDMIRALDARQPVSLEVATPAPVAAPAPVAPTPAPAAVSSAPVATKKPSPVLIGVVVVVVVAILLAIVMRKPAATEPNPTNANPQSKSSAPAKKGAEKGAKKGG